jgi:predicted flap endonuclease-1-like 5' DNA nuclease
MNKEDKYMATYKIIDIEGIGPAYAEKLKKVGVKSVNGLLQAGCSRKGRKQLAEKSGIDETLILKWVNMADLYRIKGVGSEYSELLEKAGVDTIKELAKRKPDHLFNKIVEVNSQGRALVRQLPAQKIVQNWIEQAKNIDPKVTY